MIPNEITARYTQGNWRMGPIFAVTRFYTKESCAIKSLVCVCNINTFHSGVCRRSRINKVSLIANKTCLMDDRVGYG
jgi:hypothetical protein